MDGQRVAGLAAALRRLRRLLPLVLAWDALAADSAVAAASAPAPADSSAAARAAGKLIYREGRLGSGEPLVAVLASGVRSEGAPAACATCHRASGLGGAEGPNVIKPLTVPGFFADQENNRRYARRPAVDLRDLHYTDQTFDRALREGISVDGRALNPLMPRYALARTDIAALREYLTAVAMQPAPGVTEQEIHFATVITPDAEPRVREATLQVLQAMVEARNAGTRSETKRLRAGVDRMHVSWRRWRLHRWELSGSVDSWGEQLARRYREQPVFALLSGAGGRWQAVHDFCEREEVPCLFPNVDLPGRAEPGRYSVYLSRGLLLEADVIAAHLQAIGWKGPVLQIRSGDHRAEAAAHAFASSWQRYGHAAPPEIVLREPGGLAAARAVAQSGGDATNPVALVLWLDAAGLQAGLQDIAAAALPAGVPVLVSGTLLGEALPPALQERWPQLRIAWPFALPAAESQRFDRVRDWLASRGVRAGDARTQANTYFAFTMASDAVAHLTTNYSRDYLIERIEHNADKSLATGAFPQLGLGPGQRFASKGAYLVRAQGGNLSAEGGWIVP